MAAGATSTVLFPISRPPKKHPEAPAQVEGPNQARSPCQSGTEVPGPQHCPSGDEGGTQAQLEPAGFQARSIPDLSAETSPHRGTRPSLSKTGPDLRTVRPGQGDSLLPFSP